MFKKFLVVLAVIVVSGLVLRSFFSKESGRFNVQYDRYGNMITDKNLKTPVEYSEGLKTVRDSGGKFGYMDESGTLVIDYKFDDAKEFSDGLAVVWIGGAYQYIRKDGTIAFQQKFLSAKTFSEGLAVVEVDHFKFGYINTNGDMVIKPQFLSAFEFQNGKALARRVAGKTIVINKNGEEILPEGDIITARSGESAKIMLLNYAFWMLHADYSFVPEKLTLLKEIANEYLKLGEEKKHNTLMKLYEKYKPDTFVTSYDPAYTADYQMKWWAVKKLADQGQYQDAINASDGDPFALANIAQAIYTDTGDHKTALDLTNTAFEHFGKSSYPALHLTGIANAYNKLNEYEKAYHVVMTPSDARYWSTTILPIAKYYSDKQDMDKVLQLVLKTSNGDGRAEALLYLIRTIKNDEAPLDSKYVQTLNSALK